MRPALGLLLLVMVVFGVLYAAPRLVDESVIRSFLVRVAEKELGARLEITGAVEFSLLPRPVVSFARARLTVADRPFEARVDRVDVALAMGALLRGELVARSVRVVRPQIRIEGNGLADLLPALVGRSPGALSFGAVEILGGRVEWRGLAHLRPLLLERLDLLLERAQPNGLVVEGRGRIGKFPLVFRVATRVGWQGNTSPLEVNLRVGPGGELAKLLYRGTVRIDRGGTVLEGRSEVALADPTGFLRLVDALLAERLPPLPADIPPLRFESGLSLDPGELLLDKARFDIGGEPLEVRLRLERAPEPLLELRIAGESLDLRVLPEFPKPWLSRLPKPPFPIASRLELSLATLRMRGRTVRDLRLVAEGAAAAPISIRELHAVLPGEAELVARGTLDRVAGRLRLLAPLQLTGRSLRTTLLWLGLLPEREWPQGVLESYYVKGNLRLGEEGASLRDAELRLDSAAFRGSFAYLAAARPQIAVRGTVDRLDLDPYLAPRPGGLHAGDLGGLLKGFDLAVDLTFRRLRLAGQRIGSLTLQGSAEEGRVTLGTFAVRNFLGASGTLAGTFDPLRGTYDLVADFELPSPARLARLAGVGGYDLLAGLGTLRGRATLATRDDVASLQLEADAPRARLRVQAESGDPADWRSFRGRIRLDAPRFTELAAALGVPALRPAALPGPMRLELTVDRSSSGALETRGQGRLAQLAFEVEARNGAGANGMEATLTLDRMPSPELTDSLWRLAASFTPLLPRPPRSWPGDWPAEALDWSRLEGAPLRLELRIGDGRGGLRFDLHDRRARFTDLDLPLLGGRLSGTLELDRSGGGVVLAGRLDLERAAADALLLSLGVPRVLDAELDGFLDLRSGGRSIADLVRHLSGSGELHLRNGWIAGIGEQATDRVLPDIPGRLPFRVFGGSLRIRRGTLESAPERWMIAGREVEGGVDLRADLYSWMADIELALKTADGRRLEARLFGPFPGPEVLRWEESLPAVPAEPGSDLVPRP